MFCLSDYLCYWRWPKGNTMQLQRQAVTSSNLGTKWRLALKVSSSSRICRALKLSGTKISVQRVLQIRYLAQSRLETPPTSACGGWNLVRQRHLDTTGWDGVTENMVKPWWDSCWEHGETIWWSKHFDIIWSSSFFRSFLDSRSSIEPSEMVVSTATRSPMVPWANMWARIRRTNCALQCIDHYLASRETNQHA